MTTPTDPLAGGQEETTQSVTFGKIGDFIKGIYTGSSVIDDPNNPGKKVTIYEVKGELGSYHKVDKAKMPIEPPIAILSGSFYILWGGTHDPELGRGKKPMDKFFGPKKPGIVVGIRFEETIAAKVKSHSDTKKYLFKTFGVDPNYMGEDSKTQVEEVDVEGEG